MDGPLFNARRRITDFNVTAGVTRAGQSINIHRQLASRLNHNLLSHGILFGCQDRHHTGNRSVRRIGDDNFATVFAVATRATGSRSST